MKRIGVALVICLVSFLALLAPARGEWKGKGPVYLIDFNAEVNPFSVKYAMRAIGQAERADAAAVVIELNTPGGLGSSMDELVQRMLSARVPVVVYVSPSGGRAASAGVWITYAADVAAMAPGTNIGAAHPVMVSAIPGAEQGSGDQEHPNPGEDVMKDKVLNDAIASLKAIAELKGRNAEWAEQAVRESVSITDNEALEKGVIELRAESLSDLLGRIDGMTVVKQGVTYEISTSGKTIVDVEWTSSERFMSYISSPQIAVLLFLVGIIGIGVELTHPGTIFPGVMGGIAILLGLMAFNNLPIQLGGIMLIILGIVLLVAELKVQGFGILGVGALLALFFGLTNLFDKHQFPNALPPNFIISVMVVFVLFAGVIVWLVFSNLHRRTVSGREGMIGRMVEVRRELSPRGKVFFQGTLWDATLTDGGSALPGEELEIVEVSGLKLKVKKPGTTTA